MTETLPAAWYVDERILARERRDLFGRSWLVAGHVGEIPAPGALAVTVAGWPLLLVRDDEGIRGFHNVCRHRAAPLLWDGEAERCRSLRCRYHGWRYGLDGALLSTSDFQGQVPDGLALHPVRARTWRGLVLVRIDGDGPLDDAVAGVPDALDLSGLQVHRTTRHRLRCNWKTYVENYLEGYHIPWLHPGLKREVDLASYRVEVSGRAAIHRVSTREGAVNEGFWVWLWPNTALNVYGGGASVERMNPVGPDAMEIAYTYLFAPEVPEGERERAIAMSQELTEEDRRICEAVQANLAAGVYQTGWLSPRHENGVAAFQAWVRAALSD